MSESEEDRRRLDLVSMISRALQVEKQERWRMFVRDLGFAEAEVAFRVHVTDGSKFQVQTRAVFSRGDQTSDFEGWNSFPIDTPADDIVRGVFGPLRSSALSSRLPYPADQHEEEEEPEEEPEDEEMCGAMNYGKSAAEIQSEAIKIELARRLAGDVVDALDRASQARSDLHTRISVTSGPDARGEDEAWIEILISVQGRNGVRARSFAYVHPGQPPSRLDDEIQKSIRECDEELAKSEADGSSLDESDSIPY